MPDYTFDVSRARLRGVHFKPLYVKKTLSLPQACAQHRVHDDTPILLLNHPDNPIALVTTQMAYHHVAQGEIAGDPWLVTF